MFKNKVRLQSQGIKRALKNYNMVESLAEYIWNGFDAKATIVDINLCKNKIGGVDSITISDNGYGISEDTLKTKFVPVFESNKVIERDSNRNNSTYHGKNGVGRLTFFAFADNAHWETCYRENDKNSTYDIYVNADSLEDFSNTEKQETHELVGTKVTFTNIATKFNPEELIKYLASEFAWFIELRKDVDCKLRINGEELVYGDILADKSNHQYKMLDKNISFDVKFCRWNEKLNNEYSKYYYINSNGEEVYKENTTLNNKGDKFFHSVFIRSTVFDNFTFNSPEEQIVLTGYTKDDSEYKFIKNEVDKLLRAKRNPYIKEYTKKYLAELEKNGAYPNYDKNSFIDAYKKDALDDLISKIYYAEPKIFSKLNSAQQKTMIRMFDLIMQSDETADLLKIMDSILDMTADEKQELSSVLEYSTMSNITKTIALLKDRAMAVAYLKALVFDEKTYANEVDHLQPFIEKHYWMFGEQYHLVTAEEPDFEEALRRYLYILKGEKAPKGTIKIDHEHKQKEMDIFAVQQTKSGDVKKCVVVELKHPNITLRDKEFSQVKKYFEVIKSESRFNASNIEWEFYLIGNKIHKELSSAFENAKPHGLRSLVIKANNCKIFIKTWSEIFTEFEINHDFLMEKLQLKQANLIKQKAKTAKEIVKEQESNTAIRPSELSDV